MAYERQTFVDNETTLTAEHLNHIEDGIVQNETELKKKAELDEEGKLKAEQLPDAALTNKQLKEAVNTALAQAKESGEFTGPAGEPGDTPVKGEDYFTEEDKAELVTEVISSLPEWTGGAY